MFFPRKQNIYRGPLIIKEKSKTLGDIQKIAMVHSFYWFFLLFLSWGLFLILYLFLFLFFVLSLGGLLPLPLDLSIL